MNNPSYRFAVFGAGKKFRTGSRHRTQGQREEAGDVIVSNAQLLFLGKLASVFRYSMSPDGQPVTANVGILREFVGQKAIDYFEQFQEGGKLLTKYRMKPFSQPSMSRYWAALGHPLRTSTPLEQPRREVIVPTWERNKDYITDVIRSKFEEKLGEKINDL